MTISINKLTKIYGEGESAVVALNEFDLEIATEEIVIVRGPNGSGKTTLISILSGELQQTAGWVRIDSQSAGLPTIAVIGQFHNLIDELTVDEHFTLLNSHENRDLIEPELWQQRAGALSRGQAQRVAIALALNSRTDLLLADEPTGALGVDESEELYDFILQAARRNGTSVLLVTHDVHADRIADRIVRLRDGRLSDTWRFGGTEKQVISSTGWVRIPDSVVDGLATDVEIQFADDGAVIAGRERPPAQAAHNLRLRTPGSQVVVQATDVTTSYGDHIISKGLCLKVAEGSIFAVLGKSGAGKTTLLKALAGVHREVAGHIERPESLPYFNTEEPFGLGLRVRDFEIPAELVSQLSLEELQDRQLRTLSGGQRQRAMVAIALSSAADVILLDEPTSALDEQRATAVIEALCASAKTIIVATHDDRLRVIANADLEL